MWRMKEEYFRNSAVIIHNVWLQNIRPEMRVALATLVLACLALPMASAALSTNLIDEAATLLDTAALVGGVARLPCDLRPPVPGDTVTLVIWYKGGISSPIYSLDARGRPARQQPTHWADERTLGGRAFFRAGSFSQGGGGGGEGAREGGDEEKAESAHLAIENVREADAGAYRCRVDFHRSPTRNALLNLAVIVPPHSLTLEDAAGSAIAGAALGPFPEGAFATVTCVAHGGVPPPRVWWQRDGATLLSADVFSEGSAETEASEESEEAGGGGAGRGARAESTLRLGPLSRADSGAVLLCRAANSHLAPPLRRAVHIHMTLAPLAVTMLGGNRPLRAGEQHEVACEAVGGRPPPAISWRLAGKPLLQARQTESAPRLLQTSADSNVTTSTLTLTPSPDDLGRELECSAEGDGAPPLRDAWTLDVRFPPELSVSLGGGLNASAIREGDDVYLECAVRAHPRAPRVEWRHGGRALASNASAGVLVTNQTLVLQAVRNGSAGQYACAAANSQGAHTSRPFHLDVKYAPVCRAHQQRVYGAARMETLQVSCEVDANPPAALFRWSFNSSSVAAREVTSVSSAAGGGRSVAAYTPRAERDFGTLLCWGRNALGAQGEPCVFHVVPAGRPEAPRHCALRNRTWSALQVACARGFDGGLPQRFTLEVYAAAGGEGASKGEGTASKGRLVANVTARSAPEFTVAGLEAGAAYVLSLYASNGKGRSEEAVTLRAATLRAGAHEPRRTAAAGGGSGGGSMFGGSLSAATAAWPREALWALAGAGAALAAAGATAAAMAALRARGMPGPPCCPSSDDDDTRSSSAEPSPAPSKAGFRGGGGGSVAGIRAAPDGGTLLPAAGLDDAQENPDVVPQSGDTDYEGHGYKSLENHSFGYSTRAHSMDSAFQTPLYVSLHSYSRVPTTESLLSSETPGARWAAWPSLRDVATQAQALPATAAPRAAGAAGAASAAPRQNAETQTPLPRHKESAV